MRVIGDRETLRRLFQLKKRVKRSEEQLQNKTVLEIAFCYIVTGMSDHAPLRMPVLFVGHGSPMNAIEDTEFSRGWEEAARKLPRPSAILCISAHWETTGSRVTGMDQPPTIHDFGGFPHELYEVQYPAPGSLTLAQDAISTVRK